MRTSYSSEIESRAEFDARIVHASSLAGWRVQDVDLRGCGDLLARVDVAGSLFLGCYLDDPVAEDLRERGALVFPRLPQVPFDPYRGGLYTPEELYDGLGTSYGQTPDAVVYAWSRQRNPDLVRTLATALHDHSVDDALTEFLTDKQLVGVMGGHTMERGGPGYAEAARLGRVLARAGLVVATGGGPGAMEAANLGAYLAGEQDEALPEALDMLSRAPSFRPSVGPWATAAFEVRKRWPAGVDGRTDPESLGVPTWFYGHEPPNAFATRIAKYFKNAIREDVLLHCCNAGIVFLPGSGGTVQEVFQDACENYYADASSVRPMILVGADYWTTRLPVWPLLESLARERAMGSAIHLVDHLDEVAPLLARG